MVQTFLVIEQETAKYLGWCVATHTIYLVNNKFKTILYSWKTLICFKSYVVDGSHAERKTILLGSFV